MSIQNNRCSILNRFTLMCFILNSAGLDNVALTRLFNVIDVGNAKRSLFFSNPANWHAKNMYVFIYVYIYIYNISLLFIINSLFISNAVPRTEFFLLWRCLLPKWILLVIHSSDIIFLKACIAMKEFFHSITKLWYTNVPAFLSLHIQKSTPVMEFFLSMTFLHRRKYF